MQVNLLPDAATFLPPIRSLVFENMKICAVHSLSLLYRVDRVRYLFRRVSFAAQSINILILAVDMPIRLIHGQVNQLREVVPGFLSRIRFYIPGSYE